MQAWLVMLVGHRGHEGHGGHKGHGRCYEYKNTGKPKYYMLKYYLQCLM